MGEFKRNKRQNAILDMVAANGFVATEDLVSHFNVTPQTIRRDLNEMDREGLLTRFHGGAGNANTAENPPYTARVQAGVEAKRKIAAATAALVPNGASLFLSTGTTIEAVAEALLEHKNLHIFTNNLHIAQILTRNESFQIIVSCGQVRHHDGGITGSHSEDFFNEFRMDIGIVGISGVDEDGVLLEYDPQEVKTAKIILKNSSKTIMVADHYKFGRRAMNRVGHVSDLDAIVTDRTLSAPFRRLCKYEGVDVHVASRSEVPTL